MKKNHIKNGDQYSFFCWLGGWLAAVVEESATVRMLQAQIKDNEDLFQEEINELQNRLLAAEESVEEARRQLEEAETQSSLHNQEVLQLQDQIATYERRLEQTNRETMQRDRVRSAGQEEVNRLNVLVEELEARTHFMQLCLSSKLNPASLLNSLFSSFPRLFVW